MLLSQITTMYTPTPLCSRLFSYRCKKKPTRLFRYKKWRSYPIGHLMDLLMYLFIDRLGGFVSYQRARAAAAAAAAARSQAERQSSSLARG